MKILVVGGIPYALVRFRGDLMQSMQNAGHEVVACAGKGDGLSDLLGESSHQALEEMRIRVRPFAFDRTGLSIKGDLKTIRELRQIMKEERPDVVLAYTAKPVIYGSLAARSAGVRRVYSMITGLGSSFSPTTMMGRVVSLVVKFLYRNAMGCCTKVFFQNADDRDVFLNRRILVDSRKVVLVNGSGVNLSDFSVAPPFYDPPTFLMIARLLPEKGVREYVDAAALVRAKHPTARFALVGPLDPKRKDGITEEQVRAWVGEGCIEYWGAKEDVRPSIAESSVYVLPSYGEGTPRSVLEAMSMGRPIITTDAPGCKDTILDGITGYLVRPKDSASIAEAAEKFLRDPTLIASMGASSRTLAERKYDVNAVNEVMLRAMGLT